MEINALAIRVTASTKPVVILLALFVGLTVTGRLLHVPVGDWLLAACHRYYGKYGYPAVFIGAFVEGLLVINLYLPGSTVVILGAVASRAGILNIWAVIGAASAGFVLAYLACYVVGWYGWYSAISHLGVAGSLDRARERMLVTGPRLIWLANIHPNLGALAATSAGVLRVPIRKFVVISGTSAICWTVFWGLVAFALGNTAVQLFNSWLLVPVVVVLLVLAIAGGRRECSADQP